MTLPNLTTHVIVSVLFAVATPGLVFLLARTAVRRQGGRRLVSLLAVPVVLAAGSLASARALRWRLGLPDIVAAPGGFYEWDTGIAATEPRWGVCKTRAQLQARWHFPRWARAGYLTDEHFSDGSWVATIGSKGCMPAYLPYREWDWALIVEPHPGCYVLYYDQA